MSEHRKAPEQQPHWQQPCSNKQQKKRALSGQLDTPPTTSKPNESKTKPSCTHDTESRLETLAEYFQDITDPRIKRNLHHLLIDIIVIATLAVIANAKRDPTSPFGENPSTKPVIVFENASRYSFARHVSSEYFANRPRRISESFFALVARLARRTRRGHCDR